MANSLIDIDSKMIRSKSEPAFPLDSYFLFSPKSPDLNQVPTIHRRLSFTECSQRPLSLNENNFDPFISDSGINLSFSVINSDFGSLNSGVELTDSSSIFEKNELEDLRRHSLADAGSRSQVNKRHSIGGCMLDGASEKSRSLKRSLNLSQSFSKFREMSLRSKLKVLMKSPVLVSRKITPQILTISSAKKRKRHTISDIENISPVLHRRRYRNNDASHLCVSGDFLDSTSSPKSKELSDEMETAVNTESAFKKFSPRHQVFLELVQTEINYVNILKAIMTVFEQPLETVVNTPKELLNTLEIKSIFGNFQPIYEVHQKMLDDLRYVEQNWTEDTYIGEIILKYRSELAKAYPPYINFMEKTKEILDLLDQKNLRFREFLKKGQSRPECGRQSLKELLIRPVQRLPSIYLLLNDILKHTSENNSDHNALKISIEGIKEVMTHINEDKRKTEDQVAMFDIFNEIENCPADLLKSQRSFILKCEVTLKEVSEGLSGGHLVLFLFTDILEICKKRSINNSKVANSRVSPCKIKQPFKHLQILSLSAINEVVNISESKDSHNEFALIVQNNQELTRRFLLFTITDKNVKKTDILEKLRERIAR